MDERLLRDVEILGDLARQGDWCELRVKGPGLQLLLSTDQNARTLSGMSTAAAQAPAASSPSFAPAPEPAKRSAAAPSATQISPDWSVVEAPNLGTFYRSPKPGSPPFVEVGQAVTIGTELCLIEVMKLFTSVRAEVAGTIRHVAATDGELVDGGQPLIYIEPA